MNRDRIERLLPKITEAGLDGILICPSEELKYLTGFQCMMCLRFQGFFLKPDGTCFYVSNRLYTDEVRDGFGGAIRQYTWWDGESMTDVVMQALRENGLEGATLGVNSSAQAFNVLDIAAACGVTFVNAKDVLAEARIIKTPEEIDGLRRAAEIADGAFTAVLSFIKPGMKELDIKNFIVKHMTEAGGVRAGALVASGPNGSYPHYMGTDRIIGEQDIVLMDYGCMVNNMRSDITRTVFVGGATEEQQKVYDLVLRANLAGEAAAVNGAWIPDIDAAARDIITEAGYGPEFTTRLGHGIGYMNHESPDIKKNNLRRLEPGMAFSIEPGIYLADRFGVRIEDILVCTEDGHEVLNKVTKEMIIL
ncbi:MAG: aminopeptidase P family protein [Clostridiales bacterium]|nr:aminopeptidase P family protein [Clostridiales bacterium]